MDLSLIFPAFLAGLLTFLAPCTLPLVPAYLSFISGQTASRAKVVYNGLFFILGFSAIFILFGTLVGFLGQTLVPYRIILTKVAGIFVILFGLSLLGVFKIPVRAFRLPLPVLERGKPINSFLIGAAFGFGWTPCVGPILGSILLLASTAATALKGALLLAIFSSGLAIPFLLVAFGFGSASRVIEKISPGLGVVEKIGGVFLILLGYLLFTNQMGLLIAWGYRIFNFINYDKLINYL
ncbi:MAG: sulfite exporter TauE/SafE family protein [Parcubacteria group bacterium]|nr:sulfite exporter TauE/SafE family protein [Parcubacteria group bacterium]